MMKQRFQNNHIRGLKYSIPLLFAAMLMLFGSCTDEHTDHPTPIGEEKTITFSVKVPGGFTPATYALTEADENAINTVDVLLFESGGGNYISGPHYGAISGSDVTIRIPEGTANYDMVILANYRKEINEATLSGTKETILSDLTLSMPSGGWIANTGNENYRAIPMWAETAVSVTGSTATVTYPADKNAIELVRMLARVNVTNNASASFILTSVYLCNYRDAGNIAPTSIIADPNKTGFANAIPYSGGTVISDNKCINEIYTFEAATASTYNVNNPCLVIGGTYGGKTNYYRVDFVKKEANDTYTYLNLLRNHKYEVNIENISGPGYTSAEDALKSRLINVVYAVEEWDDSSMADVVYNGQYTLAVSQSSFRFTKSGGAGMLTVFTDNPAGCSYEVVDGEGWLTESSVVDASGSKTYITLTVAANGGDTPTPREAKIKITSGSLKYAVTVTQSNTDVDFRINNAEGDVELLLATPFGQVTPPQTFTLNWLPETSVITYTSSNAGSYYGFDGSPVKNVGYVTSSNGTRQIVVTATNAPVGIPTKDTPLHNPENVETVTYTLVEEGGTSINCTLTLKQQVWDFFMSNQSATNLPHQSTLSFESVTNIRPDAQTVTIAFPAGSTDVSASNVEGYTITPNINLSSGTATYTIQPTVGLASAGTVNKSVDFTVTYGGLSASKTLNLSQTAVVPYLNDASTIKNYYRLNGSSVSVPITFNTNVPWEVKSVTETDAAGASVSLITNKSTIAASQGSASPSGSTLTLTSVTDTNLGGFVKVVIGTQDNNLGVDDITVSVPFAGTLTGKAASSSKDVVWAGSNIYWDEDPEDPGKGKLTFDAAPGDTPDASSSIRFSDRKQGVFFKWGSLYGVSATGDWDSVIYSPDGTSGAASAYSMSSWEDVPFISSSDFIATSSSDSYLYYRTDDRNDPSNAKFGDICRWITLMGWAPDGSKWRMPTASEFGTVSSANYRVPNGEFETYGAGLSGETGESVSFTGTNSNLNSAGTEMIVGNRGRFAKGIDPDTQGVVVNAAMPFFPAAGSRGLGTLGDVGLRGCYWSGSPSLSSAYALGFTSASASLGNGSVRPSGLSVRCVQDL